MISYIMVQQFGICDSIRNSVQEDIIYGIYFFACI